MNTAGAQELLNSLYVTLGENMVLNLFCMGEEAWVRMMWCDAAAAAAAAAADDDDMNTLAMIMIMVKTSTETMINREQLTILVYCNSIPSAYMMSDRQWQDTRTTQWFTTISDKIEQGM